MSLIFLNCFITSFETFKYGVDVPIIKFFCFHVAMHKYKPKLKYK